MIYDVFIFVLWFVDKIEDVWYLVLVLVKENVIVNELNIFFGFYSNESVFLEEKIKDLLNLIFYLIEKLIIVKILKCDIVKFLGNNYVDVI